MIATDSPSRTSTLAVAGAAVATLITLTSLPVIAACSSAPTTGSAEASSPGPAPSQPARTDAVCTAPYGFTLPTPAGSTDAAGAGADQRTILDLATRLHPSTDDSGIGDHTYLRYRLATAYPVYPDDRTQAGFSIVDYEYWIGDDRSGAATITRYPAGTPSPQPGTPSAPGAVTEHHTYPARRIYPHFPTPFIGDRTAVPIPSIDPDRPGRDSIRDAVALANAAALSCSQRVVLLAGMATAGTRYQGMTTDRAGRAGIALTADTDEQRTRYTLILDPDTGTFLSCELHTMPAPGASGVPQITMYLLFFANRRAPLPAGTTASPTA